MEHPETGYAAAESWLVVQFPFLTRFQRGQPVTVDREQYHVYVERGAITEKPVKKKTPKRKRVKKLEDKRVKTEEDKANDNDL